MGCVGTRLWRSSVVVASLVLASGAFVSAPASASLPLRPTPTAESLPRASDVPVAFSQLHLDEPGGTLTPGSWTISGPPACSSQLKAPGSEATTATLTEDSQGNGVFSLAWGPGGNADVTGGVLQTPSDQLAFTLKWNTSAFSETLILTGYGTTFSGTARVGDALCTWTTTAATLTLDGTGLTACLSPISSSSSPSAVLERAAGTREPHAASAPSCKLNVAISAPKQITAGLKNFRPEGGVSFVDGAASTCASGCANITVTVTDPAKKGAAVQGALVTATISATAQSAIPAYPGGKPDAYICSQGHCKAGTSLHNLVTDQNGQVRVVFWTPGLINVATTRFVARVIEHCSGSDSTTSCQNKEGVNSASIVVTPDTFLDATNTLSPEEVAELITWSGAAPSSRLKGLTKDLGREALIKALEHNLEVAENEGGAAFTKWLGLVFGAVLEGLEFKESLGAMDMMFAKFGVPGVGLGYTAKDVQQISAGPSHSFVDAFVGNQHLGVGPAGVVFKYAQALASFDAQHGIGGDQQIHMKIYDVSYCPFGGGCPSYPDSIIPSYLYIQFWSTEDDNGLAVNGWHFDLLTQYQAQAWTRTLDKA